MSRFTNKLQNQTAIIFGGTGGVGMGIAAGLIEHGGNVIITGSRQQRLDTQLSTLRSQYPSVPESSIAGFVCDLASTTSAESNLQTLLSQVQAHLSSISSSTELNHIIYAAGDSLSLVPLADITQDKFHTTLQVRVTSCILAVKTFYPLLPKTNRSTITLTGGSICEKPIAGGWAMLAFLASGLNGLARQLASDLAPVRVNSVAPGLVDTDLWAGMSEEERKAFFEARSKEMPTGAVGQADDVAEVYLYLMRDANVTGSTMHTNGGAFLI